MADLQNTELTQALAYLKAGKLVAFPTETVYGLGADASNPEAIAKVFALKQRPLANPLIVHIASIAELSNWAVNIPDLAYELASVYWPGPLTMILQKHPEVSNLITAGQNTVALRMPNHPQALQLLREFKGALVGPSANKFSRVSPTKAEHVSAQFASQDLYILDGGYCSEGIESSIVNLSVETPQLLRRGTLSLTELQRIIPNIEVPAKPTVRTAGQSKLHYAPLTPISLVTREQLVNCVSKDCAVLSFVNIYELGNNIAAGHWQQVSSEPRQYAHELYATLHELDGMGLEQILVELPPNTEEWQAILDKLGRAAHKD